MLYKRLKSRFITKETYNMAENLLEEKFNEAEKGRQYWITLQEKYSLESSDYVLLIPDKEDIIHLKKRFQQFISKKHGRNGLILAGKDLLDKLEKIQSNNIFMQECSSSEAHNLMRFYCMYQFTANLLIASLEKPDGRRGSNLIGKKGLEREEILDMVVFGIEKE